LVCICELFPSATLGAVEEVGELDDLRIGSYELPDLPCSFDVLEISNLSILNF
jgi:hypothetical protein